MTFLTPCAFKVSGNGSIGPPWFTYQIGRNASLVVITHELVTAWLQTAVWGIVEHYSHHTTQKVWRLYSIAFRKHWVAHYLTQYSNRWDVSVAWEWARTISTVGECEVIIKNNKASSRLHFLKYFINFFGKPFSALVITWVLLTFFFSRLADGDVVISQSANVLLRCDDVDADAEGISSGCMAWGEELLNDIRRGNGDGEVDRSSSELSGRYCDENDERSDLGGVVLSKMGEPT